MKPESIVEKLISAVERGDLDKMASLYAPNAIQHHPLAKGQLTGRQAIREAKLPLVGAFPNATFKTRTLLANESTVVAEGVLSATNTGVLEFEPGQQLPPTGRPIEIPSRLGDRARRERSHRCGTRLLRHGHPCPTVEAARLERRVDNRRRPLPAVQPTSSPKVRTLHPAPPSSVCRASPCPPGAQMGSRTEPLMATADRRSVGATCHAKESLDEIR